MARKTFREISGVKCERESCKIISPGDILYYIDVNNNFEIVNAICKKISRGWNSTCEIFFCLENNAEKFKDFIPQRFGIDAKKHPVGILAATGKSNRSHNGLLFTDFEDAKEYQAKMRNGKTFIQLKPDDTIYAVGGDSTEIVKLTISKTEIVQADWDDFTDYVIYFKNGGYITFGHLRYEDKACSLLDSRFYCRGIKGFERYDSGNSYFFVNEEDAAKLIKDRQNRKKKAATAKYFKQMENYDGKPIKHNDSNDNPLHYGDKVAYAVSGGSSSPFISIGKVVGETKQKVTIEDVAKKDGNHNVCSCSIIIIEEAKVNVNSGYSFLKGKQ